MTDEKTGKVPPTPEEVLLQVIGEMGKGLSVLRTEIRMYGRMSRLGLEQVTSTMEALGILLAVAEDASTSVIRAHVGIGESVYG